MGNLLKDAPTMSNKISKAIAEKVKKDETKEGVDLSALAQKLADRRFPSEE